jgi:hypothetical protein
LSDSHWTTVIGLNHTKASLLLQMPHMIFSCCFYKKITGQNDYCLYNLQLFLAFDVLTTFLTVLMRYYTLIARKSNHGPILMISNDVRIQLFRLQRAKLIYNQHPLLPNEI